MARVATIRESEAMLDEFLADLYDVGATAHMLVMPIPGKLSTVDGMTATDILDKCTMIMIPYIKPGKDYDHDCEEC
jgi:hypothetical protein